ncbi:AfsR/SARP family transcriptional regulator [Amycolatopsis orientalis]|uniref:AfsR/SARP family transcriptional regulator n=1 Tax=Amycolatopsis orientalis TaxID=31958 RepID=UPI000417D96A|nr:BTAD domain-containing putative transcriptional regulator [Amycolatopsis orientalis]
MAFRVLGPLEVEAGGRLLEVGGPRLRALLALLVADAGRVVSLPALVEGLWGLRAPPDADRTTRVYVSLLRKALRPAAAELIVTRRPGYVLRLEPDAVDAVRFERLAAAGRRSLTDGEPAVAVERLTAALGLWRGDAYGEFVDTPALRAEAERLEQIRVSLLADRIEAGLAVGDGERMVAELNALTGRHPGHERLWGLLMTALYQAGRQADALTAYRRARTALVRNSGVEPTPALSAVHRRILGHDPSLLAPSSVRGAPPAPPAQLPPAVPGFTGRAAELSLLDSVLTAAKGIAVVSGTAGAGKTALAVHWAHGVAAAFPDGQLYVDLRGFDPVGSALDPADVLRGFLDAFGVPATRLPADRDALTGLYRSVVAGKRMLVVLDNAGDAGQVRPLLPGSPGCLVVVTSRHQFTSLIAVEGAHSLALDLLSPAEAKELLTRRLGPERVAAEPAAVAAIIAGCARLPLALAVVAARAALHPGFRLATVAAQLDDVTGVLDALHGGDRATDVRAVFSWSCRALSADAARLFRLLGLHPGRDIGLAAAASVAGLPLPAARPLLAELTRASLLAEHAPGRYTFHDLLRAYAAEQARAQGGEPEVRRRSLDHYLHTGHAAALLLQPHRAQPITPAPAANGVTVVPPADLKEALSWFTLERPALLAGIESAAVAGSDTHTYQLAWTLATFLERRGHWHDLAATQRAAVGAARRLADRSAEAHAHDSLAGAYVRLGRFADAHTHLGLALVLFAGLGDRIGLAHTHLDFGWMFERQGRHAEALDHAVRALGLFRAVGHQDGEARALNQVGWCHAQLEDHEEAIVRCRQALALHQALGDRAGEAHTWDSLGHAHHHLGFRREAVTCYQRAIDLFRRLGDRYNEAGTLTHFGNVHQAAGDSGAANAAWQHAIAILGELDRPENDPTVFDSTTRPMLPAGTLRRSSSAGGVPCPIPRTVNGTAPG